MKFRLTGFNEFQKAIEKNPAVVVNELKDFFVRGLAIYKKFIIRNPWEVGSTGGGTPVDTKFLRDSHDTKLENFSARIFPTAGYRSFIHEGTYKMKKRPWLDYAFKKGEREVRIKERQMLKNIVKKLAR